MFESIESSPECKPKLVHIYGFAINSNNKLPVKKPAKLFKLPFYGYTKKEDNKTMDYIGIKIKSDKNPFITLYKNKKDIFEMSSVNDIFASSDIINQMQLLYPDQINLLKCHSFLTDIYTSNYYSGIIMVGYFIDRLDLNSDIDSYTSESDSDVYITDIPISDIISNKIDELGNLNCEMITVSHTLTDKNKDLSGYFIGCQISDNFVNFDFSHDDPGNCFYKMCTQKYNLSTYHNYNLKFKDGFIVSNKMIAFIPTMCYCCT